MLSRAEIARMHLDRALRYGDARTWSARKERSHYRRAATALRFGSTPAKRPTIPIYMALVDVQQKLEMLSRGKRLPSQTGKEPAETADMPTQIEFRRDLAIAEIYRVCKTLGESALPRNLVLCMRLVAGDFPVELEALLRLVETIVNRDKKLSFRTLDQERKQDPTLGRLYDVFPHGTGTMLSYLNAVVESGIDQPQTVTGFLYTLLV